LELRVYRIQKLGNVKTSTLLGTGIVVITLSSSFLKLCYSCS